MADNDSLTVQEHIKSGRCSSIFRVQYKNSVCAFKIFSQKEKYDDENNRVELLKQVNWLTPTLLKFYNHIHFEALEPELENYLPEPKDSSNERYGIVMTLAENHFPIKSLHLPYMKTEKDVVGFIFELVYSLYMLAFNGISHHNIYHNLMYREHQYKRCYEIFDVEYYIDLTMVPTIINSSKFYKCDEKADILKGSLKVLSDIIRKKYLEPSCIYSYKNSIFLIAQAIDEEIGQLNESGDLYKSAIRMFNLPQFQILAKIGEEINYYEYYHYYFNDVCGEDIDSSSSSDDKNT